jgi:hypothetical protein
MGGEAITYRLWQAIGALALFVGNEATNLSGPLRGRGANAFTESTLINLRALIGFVLIEATRSDANRWIGAQDKDVRASWYGATLNPTPPRAEALKAMYDAIGTTLAHAAVRYYERPGDWPDAEALLLVAEELQAFVDQLPPGMAALMRTRNRTLVEVLGQVDAPHMVPYPPHEETAREVNAVRQLLRSELGWLDDAEFVQLFHRTDQTGRDGIEEQGFTPTGVKDRAGKVCMCETWDGLDRWSAHGPWVVVVTLPRPLAEAFRCYHEDDRAERVGDEVAVPVEAVNASQPFAYRLHNDGPPPPP